jgi:hypothetical protein
MSIWLIAFLMVSGFACETYTCGEINNAGRTGTTYVCGNNTVEGFKITECPDDYQCNSLNAQNPSKLKSETHCAVPSSEHGIRAPGDICSDNSECFGEGFCMDNVCQAVNPNLGAKCNQTMDCGVKQFCKNSKCVKQFQANDVCENYYEGCPYGTVCTHF